MKNMLPSHNSDQRVRGSFSRMKQFMQAIDPVDIPSSVDEIDFIAAHAPAPTTDDFQNMLAKMQTLKHTAFTTGTRKNLADISALETIKTPGINGFYPGDQQALNDFPQSFHPPDHIAEYDTIPMLVLKDISSRQGVAAPLMDSEISGAAGGAAIVGIGNIMGSILKFVSNYLLQVGFGATLYGLYSIGLSLVQLLASLCNLGLSDTTIRYTAIYQSKQQTRSLNGLIFFCTSIAAIMGLLGALGLLLFSSVFADMKHEPSLAPFLTLMAPLVPLLCVQTVWLGSLQGLKLFKWRVLAERVLIPCILLLLTVGFFFFSPTIFKIALATLVSTLAGAIAAAYFLARAIPAIFKRKNRRYEVRTWISFAIFNFLTSVTEVVLESIDTLLLVFLAISNSQIGQYNAAVKISDFIAMPLFSLNTMFTPTIAELYSKGETQKLGSMYKIVNKWTIILSLPIFFVATLFSRTLLQLSGKSFLEAWPLLVVSALGSMINAATGSVGYMLLMTGHQKVSFFNSVVSVTLNVAFGVLLIPTYGAMGAALGTASTLALVNIMRYCQVRWLLKLHPYGWDTLKPLAAGAIGACITGILLYVFRDTGLFVHLLFIPVFLASYVGCLLLFKGGPEDAIVVDALRNKLMRNRRPQARSAS